MSAPAAKPAPVDGEKLSLDSKAHGGRDKFEGLLLPGKGKPPTGIVMLHGRNGSPDGAVVGWLRKELAAAGYWTLSLANPIPKAGDEFPNYVADLSGENYVFPEAAARLRAGIAALKDRGVQSVALAGFSMGGRMMASFLAGGGQAALPIRGLVALSIGVNGAGPLNTLNTLGNVRVPVIDISGGGDGDVASTADKREAAYGTGAGKSQYVRIVLQGSIPHNLAGAEAEAEKQVCAWLAKHAPIVV